MWQSEWTTRCSESEIELHIREIKIEIGKWPWSHLPNYRKLETALARLRIGHTELNANRNRFGYFLSPLCSCGAPDTKLHVLLECSNYDRQRDIQEFYD